MAAPGPDLQRLYSGEGTPVESSTLFPSLAICNRSFVRCPWSLWNSQYLVLSLLVRSVLIWDGHLKTFSCCTSHKTCDTEAVRGVNCRDEY